MKESIFKDLFEEIQDVELDIIQLKTELCLNDCDVKSILIKLDNIQTEITNEYVNPNKKFKKVL